jgi:hypothetical protein
MEKSKSLGATQAHNVTGPAKGPLPTSSMPIRYFIGLVSCISLAISRGLPR